MTALSTPTAFSFRSRSLAFTPGMPLLMGIVNATPDSFSDGGMFLEYRSAVRHAQQLVEAGAAIIDIGGESTRPGARPVPADVELSRILPVIKSLRDAFSQIAISVDTSKAVVARAALEAGADIVNDVCACRDPGMFGVLAEFEAGCVLMDSRKLPASAEGFPEVRRRLQLRLRQAMKSTGLSAEHFLLDPGVGFGKNLAQNLSCIRHAPEFAVGASGVLLGVSRKSWIAKSCGDKAPECVVDPGERLPATLTAAILARGVQVLRVHDVAEHRQALLAAQAISPIS